MSTEQTIKCNICGEPYKVYAFYAGDQSACPRCVRKASAKVEYSKEWVVVDITGLRTSGTTFEIKGSK